MKCPKCGFCFELARRKLDAAVLGLADGTRTKSELAAALSVTVNRISGTLLRLRAEGHRIFVKYTLTEPPGRQARDAAIRKQAAQGRSLVSIAREFKISATGVTRVLRTFAAKQCDNEFPEPPNDDADWIAWMEKYRIREKQIYNTMRGK